MDRAGELIDAILFPPGIYDTVNVVIGAGEGHNWWCLAYPSLCFIDASYDYIPKESEEYLKVFSSLPKSSLERLFYGGFSASEPEEEKEEVKAGSGRNLFIYSNLHAAFYGIGLEKQVCGLISKIALIPRNGGIVFRCIPAYAKINLCLDVLGQRPDGYHTVRMLMQSLELHDTLYLSRTETPGITVIPCFQEKRQASVCPVQ